MRDKELWEKRALPCLNEMYLKAESFFDKPFDFEMLNQYAPWGKSYNGSKERKSIYGCFYLSMDDYRKILNKYIKGFRSYWRFPYRSEIYKTGEEFEELKKAYEADPENVEIKEEYEWTLQCMEHDKQWDEYHTQLQALWKEREEKKITLKEAHKREAELSKKYGCQKRSHEREKVEFTVMDFSPNSNKEYFEVVKNLYILGELPKDAVNDKTPNYIARAVEDAELARAFIKNVQEGHKTINENPNE